MFRPLYPSVGRVKWTHAVGSFFVFLIVLSTIRLYQRQPQQHSIYDYTDGKTAGTWLNDTSKEPQSEEAVYLKDLAAQYRLSKDIPWFSRRIRPTYKPGPRSSMTQTSIKFMPQDFKRVRVEDEGLELHAEQAIPLSLGESATPVTLDASALTFGISTSYNRVIYSNGSLVRDWTRWLTDGQGSSNGASIILTLQGANDDEVSDVKKKLGALGIDADVVPVEDALDTTTRYIELMHVLQERNTELAIENRDKKFLALVDDDVFFPSLGKLLNKLNTFDTTKKIYVGIPSERADWTVENNITMTYGGGAIFLTAPMVASLAELPCLNKGANSEKRGDQYWDESFYNCISEHTDEKLHVLPSFFVPEDDQYELRTGYEGGVQPLALHHSKHRHSFEPWKAHLVTSVCGEDCFLQRFWFKDSWILVNGHTISHYPDGVEVIPLSKTSLLTSQLSKNTRVVKTATRLVVDEVEGRSERKVVSWTGIKQTWRLLDARVNERNEVWQAYIKRRGSPISYGDEDDRLPGDTIHTQEGPSDVDSIIVLIWEPELAK
ncbi:hypothetical protein BX600DRAFT_429179 [Xylariales sp. PMI_506]|nr:hypothetical protein BX600DRAFT_429179 [Xylariales sp. PMI_506]